MSTVKVDEMNFGVNIKSLNKPNNYFLGGRFHIKNAIIFVAIVTCFRSFIEGFLAYDDYFYISSSDPKTMIFGSILELASILILYLAYIKKNQNFTIPYILVQIMFITIHGVVLLLDILRCIWPSMPKNPLLEYKQDNKLEYIRLLIIFSIFIVDCYCLKVILKTYVYLENENIEFTTKHMNTTAPPHQVNFSIEDEEVDSFENLNYRETQLPINYVSSDEDDLDLTRDGHGKKKKSKFGDLK
uniref:Protein with signal anchor n=1 Tax=Strongyloides venezuelensis TaxID=75913 RepID=A0A0K0FMJ6_STRVS